MEKLQNPVILTCIFCLYISLLSIFYQICETIQGTIKNKNRKNTQIKFCKVILLLCSCMEEKTGLSLAVKGGKLKQLKCDFKACLWLYTYRLCMQYGNTDCITSTVELGYNVIKGT
jgi:hypothetical protein